jgi:cell division protein FtsQ
MRPLIAPRRVANRPGRAGAGPESRPDPAPSRLAYRLDRLWLTPLFRLLLRVGLPVATVVALGAIYFGDADRRAALAAGAAEMRRSIEERPEFMVTMMAIDGASPAVAEAVRAMIPVTLPVSSFQLDLAALRATVAQVDAVAAVDMRVRAGGILQVDIRERVPAILWRVGDRIEMLDATGHRVATLLDRAARPDLPVIAGEGADQGVAEALAIVAAAQPLAGRLRGLVRMGERRWDVVLDRDQRILLPEREPVRAIERIIALDQAQDMLNRDVIVVDMRNKDRPTLRMAAPAVAELRRIRTLQTAGTTGVTTE